jgi:hypothetical protein
MAGPAIGGSQPGDVRRQVHGYGACRDQITADAGQQTLDNLHPAGPEGVQVARLRHPLADVRAVGQPVPLDHGDLVEVLAEHACGQDAGHAPADHNGVAQSVLGHDDSPLEWSGPATPGRDPVGTPWQRGGRES